MSRELQMLVNIAAALRTQAAAQELKRSPQGYEYAQVLRERADMHERKALELPAEGRA